MAFMDLFKFAEPQTQKDLPLIFDFPMRLEAFIATDVSNIYHRILVDGIERTDGIPEDLKSLLWDNCLMSESQDGLISILAKAMAEKRQEFIVYDRSTKVIRRADNAEKEIIRKDYETGNGSKLGIAVTFKNYNRTDFVRLYSELEHATVASLYKSMNLSKAIQIKIHELRSSVNLADSADAVAQAQAIGMALFKGRDVLMDKNDVVETAKPELTAAQSALDFIAQKQSFYLGMPASYIKGVQSGGLSNTGMHDTRAVERGLRAYYFSVIKPAVESLLEISTTFRSDDFDMLDTATKAFQTFEATSEAFISGENKTKILNRLFGLPDTSVGDEPKEVKPSPALIQGAQT